jgi:hypothetical protein
MTTVGEQGRAREPSARRAADQDMHKRAYIKHEPAGLKRGK